jgi:hypothetical protein
VEFIGVRLGSLKASRCVGIESEVWAKRNDRREEKSSRNGLHHADAVVWEPV